MHRIGAIGLRDGRFSCTRAREKTCLGKSQWICIACSKGRRTRSNWSGAKPQSRPLGLNSQPSSDARPSADTLPPLRPVGQIGAAYLIAEGPSGLYLIDQHAAHERILYEKIVNSREHPIARQQLLEPLTIELGTELAGLVADNLATLQQSGFEIESFGSGSFLSRLSPASWAGRTRNACWRKWRNKPRNGTIWLGRRWRMRWSRSSASAWPSKTGQVLSVAEQRALLRQLEACENPRTCPHGRPTTLHMSASQLERQFGRT